MTRRHIDVTLAVMQTNELASRNIRRFRLERDLSLGELAVLAGISKQTLSKVEAGVGNPTLETLERVGQGLGVSVVKLLTDWGTPLLQSLADDAVWQAGQAGEVRQLDRIYGSGYVRTRILRIEPGPAPRIAPGESTGTLHQLFVIRGVVEAGPVDDLRVLGAGDFLRFPGGADHGYCAVGGMAEVHLTTTSPQVSQLSS